MEGLIFDIKRYSIHDGPGIRCTVFFKGCPLGCRWCHNPESRSAKESLMKTTQKLDGREYHMEQTVGERVTPEQVIKRVDRDSMFFEESGGGVTFSGGEPLFQSEFLLECLRLCKDRGYHTCVDTSGAVDLPEETLLKVASMTDMFLYDIKSPFEETFLQYIGQGYPIVMRNLKTLAQNGSKILLRMPIIPGVNDSEESIKEVADILGSLGLNYVEMLPFHNTGSDKYRRLGMTWLMGEMKSMPKSDLKPIKRMMARYLPNVRFADEDNLPPSMRTRPGDEDTDKEFPSKPVRPKSPQTKVEGLDREFKPKSIPKTNAEPEEDALPPCANPKVL